MVHSVSDALKRAMYRRGSDSVLIALLEMTGSGLSSPIRMSTDGVDTVHKGATFISFPFSIVLPDDMEAKQPTATLEIPNTDIRIVQTIRTVTEPLNVKVMLVLSDDTDEVERGPWDLELVNVTYDINTVKGTLRPPSLLNEPFPDKRYNALDYPGLS